MKNSNIVFRTSVNGYNKKDVYNYLENVNRDITNRSNEYESRLADCEEKIKLLESENSQLRTDNGKMIEENGTLSAQLKSAIAQRSIDKANIDSLKEEIDNKSAMVEEIDVACVKISLELDKLIDDYNSLNQKYLELYASLGDIDTLKQKAESYDKIVQRAKEKMGQPCTNGSIKNTENDEAVTDIDNILSRSAYQIIDRMQDSQLKFSSAIANMQKETEALKERIDSIINSSKQKIISQIK